MKYIHIKLVLSARIIFRIIIYLLLRFSLGPPYVPRLNLSATQNIKKKNEKEINKKSILSMYTCTVKIVLSNPPKAL